MTNLTLPLEEIIIEDRQRIDLGDINALADSIRQFGLLEPLLVNQNKRLLAGGRRYAACKLVGITAIPVYYKETLTEDQLYEIELEENIRRKSFSWQEECLSVAKIHYLRLQRGAVDGWEWGQRQTGEMLGISLGKVHYNLQIAKVLKEELTKPEDCRPYWKCESLADAWRLQMRDSEQAVEAELARRHQVAVNTNPQNPTTTTNGNETSSLLSALETSNDVLAFERERYYSNPLNPVGSFDSYWTEKQIATSERDNVIYISNRLFQGDSITFMQREENKGRFNHIITDIPYGIDLAMMDQDSMGIKDIDTVKAEHDVDDNLQLIKDFFPAAFQCTDDSAFVITFGDMMNWQLMYDCAIAAGFVVQRWPFIWRKTNSCSNSANSYNFTKDFEIAIICRKPKATLAKPFNTSFVVASNAEMKQLCGHPFSKPRECWTVLAEAISIKGQSILDPFAGAGSSALSLLPLERNVYCCELNVTHFNSLLENIKRYYLKLNPKFVFK